MLKFSAFLCFSLGYIKGLFNRCQAKEGAVKGEEQEQGQQGQKQAEQQSCQVKNETAILTKTEVESDQVLNSQFEQKQIGEHYQNGATFVTDVEPTKVPLLRNGYCMQSDTSDATVTTEDSSELYDPLADLKRVAQLVQNGNLAALCDGQGSPQDQEQANIYNSPFLETTTISEQENIDAHVVHDMHAASQDSDMLNIWGNIAGLGQNSVSQYRTLTGTVIPSHDRFDAISRSATFKPTHAKLDFENLEKIESIDQLKDGQQMSLRSLAQVISGEMEIDDSNKNSNKNSKQQVYQKNFGKTLSSKTKLFDLETLNSDECFEVENFQGANVESEVFALKLCVVQGPCAGSECEFVPNSKKQFTVGRFGDNFFCLGDPEISGIHLRLEVRNNEWYVVDVGSLNGTTINGVLISIPNRGISDPYKINIGDRIKLGTSTTISVSEFVQEQSQIDNSAQINRTDISAQNGNGFIDLESFVGISRNKNLNSKMLQAEPREIEEFGSEPLMAYGAYITQQGSDHKDKGNVREDFVQCELGVGDGNYGLAMLFDGHGGTQAAQLSKQYFPKLFSNSITQQKRNMSSGIEDILCQTFLQVDDQLGEESSGCTATVLGFQVLNDMLHMQMANVGDSSAIMLNLTRHQFRELTHDHKVQDEEERERLDQLQICRSHNGSRILGLNLARTLGDKYVKQADMGVIAEPHTSELISVPTQETVLVVMASDGLWDVLSFEDVAEIAGDQCIEGISLKDIVTYLADKAVARGSRDDISVLALLLGKQLPLDSHEESVEEEFVDCNNDSYSVSSYSSV